MNTLRVLAMLAIAVGGAPAAVLAGQPSPARLLPEPGGVAFTERAPQPGPADVTPEGCPYHFGSDMPAATFCVYRGVALGSRGEVCATDVVVIWSSFAAQAAAGVEPARNGAASRREVHFAFVAQPDLVLHAIVNSRRGDRAEMVGYTLDSEGASQPAGGQIALRGVPRGSVDVFSMDLHEPRRFHSGSCEFASYAGTFLGVIQPPSETATRR
jgi:hypothetical protein